MREKFARFMMGRYGVDQFSKFLTIFTIVLMVLGLFIHPILYYLGIVNFLLYLCFSIKKFSELSATRNREES